MTNHKPTFTLDVLGSPADAVPPHSRTGSSVHVYLTEMLLDQSLGFSATNYNGRAFVSLELIVGSTRCPLWSGFLDDLKAPLPPPVGCGDGHDYAPALCPGCGKEALAYFEDVESRSRVLGFTSQGLLALGSDREIVGGDLGDKARLWCQECEEEVTLPDEIAWDTDGHEI